MTAKSIPEKRNTSSRKQEGKPCR